MKCVQKCIILVLFAVLFVGCTQVQDENVNEEITKDYEILGNIIFADSEKIIIDEKNGLHHRMKSGKANIFLM